MDGNAIDWEAAARHWIDQEAGEARMPEADLFTEIEAFLAENGLDPSAQCIHLTW